MGGRPLSNPRASVSSAQTRAAGRSPAWRSGPALGLYGALAGVVATLLTTGVTTAQAERNFYNEQRADAYSEFLSASSDVLEALPPLDCSKGRTPVGPTAAESKALADASSKVQLVGSDEAGQAAIDFDINASAVIIFCSRPSIKAMTGDIGAAEARLTFSRVAKADLSPGGTFLERVMDWLTS